METNSGSADNYSHQIQFGNPHDVHALGVAAVPVGTSVLDVGCADGSLGQHFMRRGCTVVGIDADTRAVALAGKVLSKTYLADLSANLDEQLTQILLDRQEERFDVIVAMDVLEHLTHPDLVLRTLVDTCLSDHGRVIVSLPNVAHGAVRLALLGGRFEYRPFGLLDETHLRFFTKQSAEALVVNAGLQTLFSISVDRDVDDTEIPVDLATFEQPIIDAVRSDPDAFTYQHFIVAARAGATPATTAELYNLVRASREMALQETFRRQLAAQSTNSEKERNQLRLHVTELQSELDDIRSSETWKVGYWITQPIRLTTRFWLAIRRRFRASGPL